MRRRSGTELEMGTQLVFDSSCVPVSAPVTPCLLLFDRSVSYQFSLDCTGGIGAAGFPRLSDHRGTKGKCDPIRAD